jgi:hypothetical protein
VQPVLDIIFDTTTLKSVGPWKCSWLQIEVDLKFTATQALEAVSDILWRCCPFGRSEDVLLS